MTIFDIVKYAFCSLGGITLIVYILKFIAEKIADRINKKYELKLNEELKRYEAELNKKMELFHVKTENKKYVTQFRFDHEYSIIKKLYCDFFDFTYLTLPIYWSIEKDSDLVDKQIEEYMEKCDELTKYFYCNNVFINIEISDFFENGVKILNRFRNLSIEVREIFHHYKKANRLDSDAYESRIDGKVEELRAIHDELNAGKDYGRKTFELMLRKYLESLEVIE